MVHAVMTKGTHRYHAVIVKYEVLPKSASDTTNFDAVAGDNRKKNAKLCTTDVRLFASAMEPMQTVVDTGKKVTGCAARRWDI